MKRGNKVVVSGEWGFGRQVWVTKPTALINILLVATTDKSKHFSCLILRKLSSCSQEVKTSISDGQAAVFLSYNSGT